MLREPLEALLLLPEATLFNDEPVSPIWLEIVDRSSNFLRDVVLGLVEIIFS